MKVRLLTVSAKQPGWVVQGAQEYARRLPREWAFETIEIKPAQRGGGVSVERVRATEAERVRGLRSKAGSRVAAKAARLVALDEKGDGWSTAALADHLERWLQEGRDLDFLIGGADGLDSEVLAQADQRWSLSAMTMPHGLVRIVVVEQLYRAASLMSGHPYHRG